MAAMRSSASASFESRVASISARLASPPPSPRHGLPARCRRPCAWPRRVPARRRRLPRRPRPSSASPDRDPGRCGHAAFPGSRRCAAAPRASGTGRRGRNDGQPQDLRREIRRIEWREAGGMLRTPRSRVRVRLSVAVSAKAGDTNMALLSHSGLKNAARRPAGKPAGRNRPRRRDRPFPQSRSDGEEQQQGDQQREDAQASVTAKPKIRRPNWPSAADGLRRAPER